MNVILPLLMVCLVACFASKTAGLKHHKKSLSKKADLEIQQLHHSRKNVNNVNYHSHHHQLNQAKRGHHLAHFKKEKMSHAKRGRTSRLEKSHLLKKFFARKRGMKKHHKSLSFHKKHLFHNKRGHAAKNRFRKLNAAKRVQNNLHKRLEHDRNILNNRKRIEKKIGHLKERKEEIREYIDALKRLEHLRKNAHLKHNKRGHHHAKKQLAV
uniref:Shell matrix protein n=1 Tax=Laqueus rubellus TaxID=93892 RepID=A0A3G9CM11_LAQRU